MMEGGEGFIDRSKVRILLCDNDTKSSEEVFVLLCKCSYQVTKVKSPRQVIQALNAEGPDIDIILSEVDLPMSKGFKLLKYIMRDRELQRIPVIMMSAQDEVSVVVKCLKYGAADYLLKPLRSNELLNLWTHMWKRRRMLGLAEKNIVNYDIDVVVSDPSDVNTNSTTLFSDDTGVDPDINMSTHPEEESDSATVPAPAAMEISVRPSEHCPPDVPVISDRRTGQILSFPMRSELKIGESSAFFTYVKSNGPKSNSLVAIPNKGNTSQCLQIDRKFDGSPGQVDLNRQCAENGDSPSMHVQVDQSPSSSSFPNSFPSERSCTPSSFDFSQGNSKESTELHHSRNVFHHDALGNPKNGFHHDASAHSKNAFHHDSSGHPRNGFRHDDSGHPKNGFHHDFSGHSRNEFHHDASGHPKNGFRHDAPGFQPPPPYPYYIPGVVNQTMMPSSQVYQTARPDIHNNMTSSMVSQHSHVPQFPPHMPGMAPYPYFPMSMCLQPGQMPTHLWPPYGNYDPNAAKGNKVDRREAALMKFRQKRKERCFDKKIRYGNRKRLADRRPRVKGQFVRKENGILVDLNGQPASADEDDDEYEEYDEEEEDATA